MQNYPTMVQERLLVMVKAALTIIQLSFVLGAALRDMKEETFRVNERWTANVASAMNVIFKGILHVESLLLKMGSSSKPVGGL